MAEQPDDCGYDSATPPLEGLRIIGLAPAQVKTALAEAGDAALRRPAPTVWSPHEYTWHLVDNIRIAAEWMHDVRVHDHPTHYAIDMDQLLAVRLYSRLSTAAGLWSLEESCRLFTQEAAITDPASSFYYDGWKDCTAAEIIGFMAHEVIHHLQDMRRVTSELPSAEAALASSFGSMPKLSVPARDERDRD